MDLTRGLPQDGAAWHNPVMGTGGVEVKGRQGWGALGWPLRLAQGLLDQLYPPGCPACGVPLVGDEGLCPGCFAQLRPITSPFCPVLGTPFAASLGEGTVSAEALADPPPFGRARAAVTYGDLSSMLVARLKYGDRPELASLCARLMATAGGEFWPDRPLLVPVPLHGSRLRARRYNQSLLLAQALARTLGLEMDPHLVRRHRRTRQQVGLSGVARARNVQGAFALHKDALARLKGRRVVVIDDVYTTGATVKAVARTLKRGGADSVDVLTFARVVIGEDVPI